MLLIPIRVVPILIMVFGIVSIIRRKYELKELIFNAIVILIIYWTSLIILAVFIVGSS